MILRVPYKILYFISFCIKGNRDMIECFFDVVVHNAGQNFQSVVSGLVLLDWMMTNFNELALFPFLPFF